MFICGCLHLGGWMSVLRAEILGLLDFPISGSLDVWVWGLSGFRVMGDLIVNVAEFGIYGVADFLIQDVFDSCFLDFRFLVVLGRTRLARPLSFISSKVVPCSMLFTRLSHSTKCSTSQGRPMSISTYDICVHSIYCIWLINLWNLLYNIIMC